jgi:methionyl-tRNA formyltransferase
MMRILFAGTPEFAAEHLRFLLDCYLPEHPDDRIVGVYTQPDRPSGRGKKLNSSPVKQLAEAHHLPVYQPVSFRNDPVQQEFIQLKADIMIVVAYGLILPKIILGAPQYGCINVHASLLPRWRGAAPIQRSIEAGDTETGVTIMQMNEGLDTGDILLKSSCSIENSDTTASLHTRLLALGGPALGTVLQQIKTHHLKPEKQNNTHSCYAPKITKIEAKINWSAPASVIERKVRAFNPFPISFFEVNDSPVRVWKVRALTEPTTAQPGTILSCSKEGIQVATGEKILLLQQLQLSGKKPMAVSDVLNGYSEWFSVGKVLH